jgi:hypothetical protein
LAEFGRFFVTIKSGRKKRAGPADARAITPEKRRIPLFLGPGRGHAAEAINRGRGAKRR